MKGHQRIEELSILLHRAVGERMRSDPTVLERARSRVAGWRLDGSVHPRYVEAWHQVLALSPEEISQRLIERSETMCALRQCSPFAGALPPQERWQILREARGSQGS